MGKRYRDLVRKHSRVRGSRRAVLNVLADYADDSGIAWPGVAQLANDSGLSQRQVQRDLKLLVEAGQLTIVAGACGGRGIRTQYHLIIPEMGDTVSPFIAQKGDKSASKRVTNLHEKGDKSARIPSHARSEPQLEPDKRTLSAGAESHAGRPPSLVLFQEILHCNPRKNQNSAITDVVADLELWRAVLTKWRNRGYNPTNIDGMLDWYRHPDRMDKQPHYANGNDGGTSKVARSMAAIDRVFDRLEEQGVKR